MYIVFVKFVVLVCFVEMYMINVVNDIVFVLCSDYVFIELGVCVMVFI